MFLALPASAVTAKIPPVPIGEDFANVLAAARLGAEWAWRRLYLDLAGAVVGYLRAHGAADPENVAGEAFLGMARNLATFEGDEEAFRSWAFTIVHRRLLDERRSRRRRPTRPTDPADLPDVSGGDAEHDAVGSLTTAEVAARLAQLSPNQRDVLTLRVIADLSLKQTAELLGRTTGAVKALQRRGLERLRQDLDR